MTNYVQKAIEKSIEGGWRPKGEMTKAVNEKGEWIGMQSTLTIGYAQMFIDPEFWQGLGKALGWNMTDSFEPTAYSERAGSVGEVNIFKLKQTSWATYSDRLVKKMDVFENSPAYYGHRFWDWIMEGKPTEDFFKQLLEE